MPSPFLIDMVHHNPGEIPFVTRFSDARHLAETGYSAQVGKNLTFGLRFDEILPGVFPVTDDERDWVREFARARDTEIAAAKRAGLDVFYHIDLFVLPCSVAAFLGDRVTDPGTGRLDMNSPELLDLHRKMFDVLFRRFPDVDGLVVRVGETYLFDTPHHMGNTAVPLHDPAVGRDRQIERFQRLLTFLREEICVRHNKRLVYRTWDYFPDRFHADPDFYLAVTDRVEPHPNLFFSIKHTGSDFFRASHANRCLGIGRHRQVVEVQCQREYEGKGAVPCYIARGVIEGFPEHPRRTGLRDWCRGPLHAGIFTWTRGGGWFGPYLRDEFWPELNVRVLAAWQASPELEEEVFRRVCVEDYGLTPEVGAALRELCLLSGEVLLHGRYCLAAAELDGFCYEATNLWMRDDRLGGIGQLQGTFAALERAGRLDEAVAEKIHAAKLAAQMPGIAARIIFADPARTAFVRWSAEYAARLFTWIAEGWRIMAIRWRDGCAGRGDTRPDLSAYESARSAALTMTKPSNAWTTGFTGEYWDWPGRPPSPGMDASVRTPWVPPAGPPVREDWQPQEAGA